MRATTPITNPDVKPGLVLHLEGTARFVHLPPPEASPFADSTRLTVLTKAGVILSPRGDFRVYARADTADVEVFRRQVPPTLPPKTDVDSLLVPLPDQVMIGGMGEQIGVVLLAAGEIGRLQPGRKPLKLRAAPDNPYNNNPLTKTLQKILP